MSGMIGRVLKDKWEKRKKMKKLLPVASLAVIVLLCSVSAVSGIAVYITPDRQYASPQISQFWVIPPPPTNAVCQADKTVTYTVTVENGPLPTGWSIPASVASVSVIPGGAPAGWFSWLNQNIPYPKTTGSWALDIKVPLKLGKDAGGVYTITVVAVDWTGASASTTATLIVQDYDYVSETLVHDAAGSYTLSEDYNNMAVAVKVKKRIDVVGEVETLTKNEYVIMNAKGNNANYEQESTIVNYEATLPGDHLIGDEQFKSCAVMGGTGARFHENYDVYYAPYVPGVTSPNSIEYRCENINHHVTGDQRWKTEFVSLNEFDQGRYLLESRQTRIRAMIAKRIAT
jgi:hypothetical protein